MIGDEVENWNTWNPMARDYYTQKNTINYDPENYDSVTTGVVPNDERKICRFFKRDGRCFKGTTCKHYSRN